MSSEKEAVRKRLLELRRRQTPEEILRKSRLIRENLFSDDEYKSAGTLLVYVSMDDEAGTDEIILRALKENKRVAVPSLITDRSRITPSLIKDPAAELSPGVFGIREPLREFIRPVPPGMIDLVIVPGAAFDRTGGRVGFGGGYYDRLLAGIPERASVTALSFGFQVFESVPADSHDRPVRKIITESEIIDCAPGTDSS